MPVVSWATWCSLFSPFGSWLLARTENGEGLFGLVGFGSLPRRWGPGRTVSHLMRFTIHIPWWFGNRFVRFFILESWSSETERCSSSCFLAAFSEFSPRNSSLLSKHSAYNTLHSFFQPGRLWAFNLSLVTRVDLLFFLLRFVCFSVAWNSGVNLSLTSFIHLILVRYAFNLLTFSLAFSPEKMLEQLTLIDLSFLDILMSGKNFSGNSPSFWRKNAWKFNMAHLKISPGKGDSCGFSTKIKVPAVKLWEVLLASRHHLHPYSQIAHPSGLKTRPFVMIGRIIGSIAFLDFRHSFCINVIFSVAWFWCWKWWSVCCLENKLSMLWKSKIRQSFREICGSWFFKSWIFAEAEKAVSFLFGFKFRRNFSASKPEARRLQVLAVGSAPLLGQNVFVSEVCVPGPCSRWRLHQKSRRIRSPECGCFFVREF